MNKTVSPASGQALAETLVVVGLLSTTIWAATMLGQQTALQLQQDQYVRWTAFSASPSGSPGHALLMRGAKLSRAPLGEGQASGEIRRAWHYEDKGMVVARAGSRRLAVLRDAGFRPDDTQTQSRLGRSRAAWGNAADRSVREASRINARAQKIDSAWPRPSLSLDWLTPWADIEPIVSAGATRASSEPRDTRPPVRTHGAIRRHRRRRMHCLRCDQRAVRCRRCKQPRPWSATNGAPGASRRGWVDATYWIAGMRLNRALVSVALWVPSAVLSADGIRAVRDSPSARSCASHLSHAGLDSPLRHALRASQQLAVLLSTSHIEPTESFLWNGVPVAYMSFEPRSDAQATADHLRNRWPFLADLDVRGGRVSLSGIAESIHTVATWGQDPTARRLSLIHI